MAIDTTDTGVITAIVAAIAAVISSIITHLFSRPKQKADVHTSIAEGASTAVDAITEVLLQVKAELHEARIEIGKLRDENEQLRQSVALLNVRLSEIQRSSDSKHQRAS